MKPGTEARRLEALEDVYYGQIVLVGARWFVIAGALFLTLWRAESIAAIQRSIAPLVVLIAANFFLHGRYLMGLPANRRLLELAAGLDLALITLMVLAGGRLDNPFFVFYYPVVLAFALVFPRTLAMLYVLAASAAYTMVCFIGGDGEVLAIRLVTLFGTAMLGSMYWRIQRDRRRRLEG